MPNIEKIYYWLQNSSPDDIHGKRGLRNVIFESIGIFCRIFHECHMLMKLFTQVFFFQFLAQNKFHNFEISVQLFLILLFLDDSF